MTKILVITGPTGVGKTKLGIELAKKFDGEIISADSQQVYKGLDVERGKDRSFPQWGLDLVESGYNVSDWVKYAKRKIADITKRGKLPIIVGGSGQYIRELLNPSATLHVPPDWKLREKLAQYSVNELQKMVKRRLNASDWQNPRRLIRAIEVGGAKALTPQPNYDVLAIGLEAPREVLAKKIAERRTERPDLTAYEIALTKKQLLYQKKFLKARWFDITKPLFNNDIECLVKEFVQPPTRKSKSTPNT